MLRTYEDVMVEQWTVEQELLATLVERIDALYRAFVKVNFEGPHNFGDPLHVPRPFDKPPEPKSVREIFAAHHAGRSS